MFDSLTTEDTRDVLGRVRSFFLDHGHQVAMAVGREIVTRERRFVETHYDADGQQGEVRDIPVYSPRGEALLRLQETLHGFLLARDATLDRVVAERALTRLLRE